MSLKQRNQLLVGGSIIVGIVVLMFFAFVILRPSTHSVTTQGVDMAYQREFEQKNDVGNGGFGSRDESGPQPAIAPEGEVMEAPGISLPDGSTSASAGDPQQAIDRLIIRNGGISVAVEDTVAARKGIEDMVAQMVGDGAFVVSVNEYGSGSTSDPAIEMSIRVPAARFDEVMSLVAGMSAEGTTPTQSQSADDVTNQYVDLDARLETLEAARQRLLEIMAESQNAEDLLNAEQQLTQREAEIASIKGQMQYLSQSAALSAISISLQPYLLSQPVDNSWRPAETVRRAWESLLDSLRDFGDFVITFGIAILPWLVVVGLVIFGIVRFAVSRARKEHKNPQSDIEH